jgi:hypothetical protein
VVESPRIILRDPDVMATTRIARFGDFRIEKFPIDRLARRNALRARLSMKI